MSMILDGSAGVTFNNATSQNSGGVALQVVTSNTKTQISTTSATYVNTPLSLSITPLFSTSKILIMVSGQMFGGADNATMGALGITRNSTLIFDDQRALMDSVNAIVGIGYRTNIIYLDYPSTTSATTYTVQLARSATAGTSYPIYFTYGVNSISTIILMEIA